MGGRLTGCLLAWIFEREKMISNMVSVAPLATVCGNEGFKSVLCLMT